MLTNVTSHNTAVLNGESEALQSAHEEASNGALGAGVPAEVDTLQSRSNEAIAEEDKTRANLTNNEPPSWMDLEGVLKQLSWAWEAWLPNGLLTIVAAESGIGKSALVLRISACYLRGDPWPDGTPFTGETGKVLWTETEGAQSINLERARNWGLPLDQLISPFEELLMSAQLDNREHRNAILAAAQQPDVKLIVVDSLSGSHQRDENSTGMMQVMKYLAELARDTGKPVIVTHHLRKRGMNDRANIVALDRLRGSSAIGQLARVIWAIDKPDGNNDNKRLSVIKNNLSPFPVPLGITIDEMGVTFGVLPEQPQRETQQAQAEGLLLRLLDQGPIRATEIRERIEQAGLSWHAVNRIKRDLGIISFREGTVWYWRFR